LFCTRRVDVPALDRAKQVSVTTFSHPSFQT
jgi:hypothetical protein